MITILWLVLLAYLMVIYFKRHKIFKDKEKAEKEAKGDHLKKV
jgi:uncharacterized membrane protein